MHIRMRKRELSRKKINDKKVKCGEKKKKRKQVM